MKLDDADKVCRILREIDNLAHKSLHGLPTSFVQTIIEETGSKNYDPESRNTLLFDIRESIQIFIDYNIDRWVKQLEELGVTIDAKKD